MSLTRKKFYNEDYFRWSTHLSRDDANSEATSLKSQGYLTEITSVRDNIDGVRHYLVWYRDPDTRTESEVEQAERDIIHQLNVEEVDRVEWYDDEEFTPYTEGTYRRVKGVPKFPKAPKTPVEPEEPEETVELEPESPPPTMKHKSKTEQQRINAAARKIATKEEDGKYW